MKFTVDQEQLATVMSISTQLDDEAPVTIEGGLLKVAMMDRSHVAMFVAQVPIGDLEDYEPTRFVLNCEMISKKLKAAQKGTVKCEFKDNLFILKQRATIAKMDVGQEHRIVLYEGESLDEDDQANPEKVLKEMTVFIKMPNAKALKLVLSNIETGQFTLEATKDSLTVKSGTMGDGFESESNIETPVSIKGDEQPVSTYSTSLIKSVVKQFPGESNLSIKFATDRPVIVSSMGEELTMDFLLAPNIEY